VPSQEFRDKDIKIGLAVFSKIFGHDGERTSPFEYDQNYHFRENDRDRKIDEFVDDSQNSRGQNEQDTRSDERPDRGVE
jgi:hypothetical protein